MQSTFIIALFLTTYRKLKISEAIYVEKPPKICILLRKVLINFLRVCSSKEKVNKPLLTFSQRKKM